MTPELESLKHIAKLAADADEGGWPFHGNAFKRAATPAAILSLIVQVEALTVPQWISVETEPENDTAVIVLFWPYGNKENTQIAQSARYFEGAFIDEDGNEMHPPSHWMPFVSPTIPAIPGTKEAA